ncbi:MAG: GNAT family N-acetyltransferase [Chloroflexota bacterium]|nr:GNAT family N-acetyltransferase [Chloroflexota bacterium]
MPATIRLFRDADASRLAEWLGALAPAEEVYTAASLLHQRRMLPARRRPLWLVAVVDGQPVGLGRDEPQIFGDRPGLRRTWVGVRVDLRRRGLGSRLWREIEAHARMVGGVALRSWAVAGVPESESFLVARGFSRVRREMQSWVDPTRVDPGELERSTARARERGLRLSLLRDLLPQAEPALRQLFLAADRGAPGHQATAPLVAASTFRRVILQNPILDRDCSTVVLSGDEPVALCWLKGDRRLGRYGIEFTATAPDWRGQGLATFAKLAALRLAAHAGVAWVGTANDETNAPMLAINRRLGHSPLADLVVYERSLS